MKLNACPTVSSADAAVVAAREWTPYGVEVGSAQAGLRYAGEWFDAEVSLQYLRARWYAPETGRFTSRDPWEGDYSHPQSLNGWAYIVGNPILFTDPSGLIPERHQIGDITSPGVIPSLLVGGYLDFGYQYSCNCGWIDWGHAISGMLRGDSLARRILSRLTSEVDWNQYPNWTGERGIRVTSFDPIRGTIPIPTLDRIAIIPETHLDLYSTYIGGSIFIAQSEDYEGLQSKYERIQEFFGRTGSDSDFSEEDLPSNWIGFYIASRIHRADSGAAEAVYKRALLRIAELCDVRSEEESEEVYDEYVKGPGFIQGWRHWHPRLVHLNPGRCGGGICEKSRQWPTELRDLYHNALRFSERGAWWKWLSSGDPTILRQTENQGVYAIIR